MSTNPFTIPIGTSDPVDLCKGLPLFPVLGTSRAGVSGASRSYPLLDLSVTIAITRLKFSLYALFGFGVCGPAIGFLSRDVDVLRTNSNGKGQLTLTFNEGLEMIAGSFIGAYAGAGVALNLQIARPDPWYKVWAFSWKDAFSTTLEFKVDLLELLVKLIQYLVGLKISFKEDTMNRLKAVQPFVKTYGLDATAGERNEVPPELTATPKLIAPINVANYNPAMKALNERLAKIGGEISYGPSIALEYPVTLNFDKFTVVGGLDRSNSADYGDLTYSGKTVSATGKTLFEPGVKPSRVTSHVTYKTTFTLALSAHFKVSVAKFFSIEVNSPSLDLTFLLWNSRESDRTVTVHNSVSTSVEGGCVLTPKMTLTFTGRNGSSTNFQTGETVTGTVTLAEAQTSSATVLLQIEPRVAGFPGSTTIPSGSKTGSFTFQFPGGCLATGNPNHPSEMVPPSPLSPVQTYIVRASIAAASNNPCSDLQVEEAININQRFLHCVASPVLYKPAPAPPWDPLAGSTINATTSLPPANTLPIAPIACWFPYLDNEPTATVRVTVTLLDENREPYAAKSDVKISFSSGGGFVPLKPSATGMVKLERSRGATGFTVQWFSKGPYTGYSNRFYLIVNAGCQYGQTECWLDVWNWS